MGLAFILTPGPGYDKICIWGMVPQEITMITFRYVAIRKPVDGEEFIDMHTDAFFMEEVRRNVAIVAKDLPAWHANNPVVRIGRVKVEEVST